MTPFFAPLASPLSRENISRSSDHLPRIRGTERDGWTRSKVSNIQIFFPAIRHAHSAVPRSTGKYEILLDNKGSYPLDMGLNGAVPLQVYGVH